MKVEASVARRLRTPPKSANPQDFEPSAIAALRSESHRSIVVIRNYRVDPITAVSCRAKDRPLSPPSNLFRPRQNPLRWKAGLGGGAGYRPRVRKTYCDANLSP